MALALLALSIDCGDAGKLAAFWGAALGQADPGATPESAAITPGDPADTGLRLLFHQVPEPKTVKNRLHLDLISKTFEAESQRLVGLGASRNPRRHQGLRPLDDVRRPRRQRVRPHRRLSKRHIKTGRIRPMPMIDAYAAAGTFADKHQLAVDLATAVMTIEQVPEIPMFRKNTAAFVHDLDAGSLANVDGDSNYVRVQVLTNAGALDRAKQLAVVRQLTDIIAAAAGDPTLADRTWVLLTEAPEGGWGLSGHANTNAELVSAARAQIAELSKNSPGT